MESTSPAVPSTGSSISSMWPPGRWCKRSRDTPCLCAVCRSHRTRRCCSPRPTMATWNCTTCSTRMLWARSAVTHPGCCPWTLPRTANGSRPALVTSQWRSGTWPAASASTRSMITRTRCGAASTHQTATTWCPCPRTNLLPSSTYLTTCPRFSYVFREATDE